MADQTIHSEAALRHVLDGITFAPSCLDMGWDWQIETLHVVPGGVVRGRLVNNVSPTRHAHGTDRYRYGTQGIRAGRRE